MLVAGANVFSAFMSAFHDPRAGGGTGVDPGSRYVVHAISCVYIFGLLLDAISCGADLPVVFRSFCTAIRPHLLGSWQSSDGGGLDTRPGAEPFTVAGVAKGISLETIIKGTAPFLFAIIFVAVVLTIFPKIVLVLPNMMRG